MLSKPYEIVDNQGKVTYAGAYSGTGKHNKADFSLGMLTKQFIAAAK